MVLTRYTVIRLAQYSHHLQHNARAVGILAGSLQQVHAGISSIAKSQLHNANMQVHLGMPRSTANHTQWQLSHCDVTGKLHCTTQCTEGLTVVMVEVLLSRSSAPAPL
jgi:hypothetical protein